MDELRDRLQKTLGDSYAIERELGGGGMSRVFVATEVALGRRVVIKVLPEDLAGGVNVDRFRREIQLAAQLQHPHIVPVLAAGVSEGLPFYTMPFVEGESLRARLSHVGELPLSEATHVLRDVAKALAYAHRHGVVHRDIKPENVLISDETALVTDFGVAKAISAATNPDGIGTLTSLGVALGTPAYMSPEQASADPAIDHRADIYSLGALGYELLSGRPPFAARTPQQMLSAHIAETPEPVSRHRPTVPQQLEALVMRCLQKHPSDRPQSAADVVQELDSIATPIGGTQASRAMASSGRRRLPVRMVSYCVGAAIVVALAALAFRAWSTARVPLDRGVLAVLPFRVAGADPSLHYLREGMLDLMAAKLSGGGLRTTDPRSLLAVWRRKGGSENTDLAEEDALGVARSLGAGRLLLGDVVGTPRHVVISATMQRLPGRQQIAQASVEGPADSLAPLIDQLAARLLSLELGETEDRLPSLTSTSLPALHAYLDAQASYRRGDATAARQSYLEALRLDSTFALAGLGLQLAVQWGGADSVSDRAAQMVWRERRRLSVNDQALLAAVLGPVYPLEPTQRELLQARERYVGLVPDQAEGWYLLGDVYYHFGAAMGIDSSLVRALGAFRKSVALDSTFGIPLRHMVHLAIELGDSTLAKRYAALREAADSARTWETGYRIHYAAAFGDSAGLAALVPSRDTVPRLSLSELVQSASYSGTAIPEIAKLGEAWVAAAETEPARRFRNGQMANYFWSMGQARAADRALRASFESESAPMYPVIATWAGMFWDGDSVATEKAALELQRREAAAAQPGNASMREGTLVIAEMWRLTHGDTSRIKAALAELEDTPSDSIRLNRRLPVALLRAVYAATTRSPKSDSLTARLDSLARLGDLYYQRGGSSPILPMVNMTLARLFEARGRSGDALAAVRRREYGWGSPLLYAPMLREEGRLAALTGDREGAIQAYRQFLRWRYDPEPSLRPERDAVRLALAKLERESAGR